MKKLLRFVITIAIIIGIVFGIKYLVGNTDNGKYVYTKLSSANAVETISKSNVEKGLDKFDSYLKNESKQAFIPDNVKTSSSENGEFYSLRQLLSNEQTLFTYFYQKSALVTKQTKDLTNNAVSSYEKLEKQIDSLKHSIINLTDNYLDKVSNPNKDDFETIFNEMVAEYKKVIEYLATLNYDMDKMILKDYFDDSKIDISFIQNDISVQVIYAGLQTTEKVDFAKINEPLKRVKTLSSLSKQEQQKFVVAYSDVDNLLGYIQSSDKAEFIKNLPNKASYEEIGKTIFNIDSSVKTPEEGEEA